MEELSEVPNSLSQRRNICRLKLSPSAAFFFVVSKFWWCRKFLKEPHSLRLSLAVEFGEILTLPGPSQAQLREGLLGTCWCGVAIDDRVYVCHVHTRLSQSHPPDDAQEELDTITQAMADQPDWRSCAPCSRSCRRHFSVRRHCCLSFPGRKLGS